MTTPISRGWYDDPDGSDAERYFDGQEWTPQRRRKSFERNDPPPTADAYGPPPMVANPYAMPPATGFAGQYQSPLPGPPTGGYWPPPSGNFWHRLSSGGKVILAVVVGFFVISVAWLLLAQPWHDEVYDKCKATMEGDGLKGDELRTATKFCVDYTKNDR